MIRTKTRVSIARAARRARRRRFQVEPLEPRCLLAADMLVVGAVYIEADIGSDQHGDTFHVSFEGGAEQTRLTRLVIDGDQNAAGFGLGDAFFDTEAAGLGADDAFGFAIVSLETADPNATVRASVVDGETRLVLDLTGFAAGDNLVFTVDVDEVEEFDPAESDLTRLNEGFDPITSGVEFQSSQFTAFFTAPHYYDVTGNGEFRNRYDEALDGTGLDLPEDDYQGKRDRTAGVAVELEQIPEPVTIAGTVFLDNNLDLIQQSSEAGIADVTLSLFRLDDGVYVDTGHRATTDAGGDYRFGEDLELLPAVYQVRETQPDGLVSVGAIPGTVESVAVGTVWNGDPDILAEIDIPRGDQHAVDFDFAEARFARLSGHVYHDRNNNGVRDSGEEGLAGVTIDVIPVATVAAQESIRLSTNADGFYEATNLVPGEYRVVESQPAEFMDGLDRAGTVATVTVGRAINPGDEIVDVRLNGGDEGVNYDFGEILGASIRGRVHLSDRDGNCFETSAFPPRPLAGVRVQLLAADGRLLSETQTDQTGRYEFTGLQPGTYSVVEFTPDGLIDGPAHAGTVAGRGVGRVSDGGRIESIQLRGGDDAVEYNFCEHEPAEVSGFVYHDENNNGEFESSETPIGDVRLTLVDSAGREVARTTTDSSGRYSFTQLVAGLYSVMETHPGGWIDGTDTAGTVAGRSTGTATNPGDRISAIDLGFGETGVDFNFGELRPAEISGFVHVDPNRNCRFEVGEAPLEGVTVQLLDGSGSVIATTTTDSRGAYRFVDLRPGEYSVREIQPDGYFHGGQRAGSHGGDDGQEDQIAVSIRSGQQLTDYNFCEEPPASLAGLVHVDPNRNCLVDEGERLLSGVTMQLVDGDGNVVATTTTDADGRYRFDGLRAGSYSVRQQQPEGYFTGGQRAGDELVDAENAIPDVMLAAGQNLTDLNFCEIPPAVLSGRVFIDGPPIVTVDGLPPENLRSLRDGVFTADDRPLAGVVVELRNGINGDAIDASAALPGYYEDGPVRTVTDADGRYEFRGLPSGSYAVYQVHPGEYYDGLDTPGTTSGIAINREDNVSPNLVRRLSQDPHDDAIILIPLAAGAQSRENNFSEVQVTTFRLPPPPPPPPPLPPQRELPLSPVIDIPLPPAVPQQIAPPDIPWFGGAGDPRVTWHLSVVDAGNPRGRWLDGDESVPRWQTASWLSRDQWNAVATDQGQWTLYATVAESGEVSEEPIRTLEFGIQDGIPVTGDFNGDGIAETGFFWNGQWFIDLNGNGVWDDEDMWAHLGDEGDLPVTGDWDGDGKDDIGIFGPEWKGDPRAIAHEPGLPDPASGPKTRPKNIPRGPDESTDGRRILKQAADGRPRADVIDHVFYYGVEGDVPVTGDWNGDGVDTIGIFRHGQWHLDMDGDGRWSKRDRVAQYGESGDVPVVGDFDGNGVDELGVYRAGTWIVDQDGDRQLTARDRVFQLGTANDIPVVGDFDGDGTDDPGLMSKE